MALSVIMVGNALSIDLSIIVMELLNHQFLVVESIQILHPGNCLIVVLVHALNLSL